MSLKGLLSPRSGSAARSTLARAASAMSDGERLAMLDDLEQSGLGWFWASDAHGQLTYLSGAIAARLDLPLDELIGQPLTTIFTAADREGRGKSLALMLGAHKAFAGLAVRAARRPDGAVLRLAGQPVTTPDGRFAGFRGTGGTLRFAFWAWGPMMILCPVLSGPVPVPGLVRPCAGVGSVLAAGPVLPFLAEPVLVSGACPCPCFSPVFSRGLSLRSGAAVTVSSSSSSGSFSGPPSRRCLMASA